MTVLTPAMMAAIAFGAALDGGASPAVSSHSAEVKAAMANNLAAVVKLQPLLLNPAAFADPKNAHAVSHSLSSLRRTPHQFMRPKAQEPAAAVSDLFGEAVGRAQSDFDAGRLDSARMRLRGLTSLCAGCHARQLAGEKASAPQLNALEQLDTTGLRPSERAQLLAATRQFDAALDAWREVLASPRQSDADSFEQDQALRGALSVAVRAKDDPAATIELLRQAAERPGLADRVRRDYQALLKDARSWQKEQLSAATATPTALYQRAVALIEKSGATAALFPQDTERIKLLRATSYLSLALEREAFAPWRPDALYRLGVATGATLDPDLWELDSLYLEACIRENQHTPLAQRCVDRLSERTLFGYTGSGGTRLPDDVAAHLATLRELASPH